MNAVLWAEGLAVGYNGVPVLAELDIQIEAGEIVALLGPNGAGKTTTLLSLSGFLPLIGGRVTLLGRKYDGNLNPVKLARAGVGLLPEGRAPIPSLTVAENLRLVRKPAIDAFELFPALVPLASRAAGRLSGGEQQMLAIARLLAMAPKLLLVDELSLGLAPIIVERLLKVMRETADHGTAIVLVEQHVERVLDIADTGVVIARGEVQLSGPVPELRSKLRMIEQAYFGAPAAKR